MWRHIRAGPAIDDNRVGSCVSLRVGFPVVFFCLFADVDEEEDYAHKYYGRYGECFHVGPFDVHSFGMLG